jgi:hypothetical protein
MNAGIEVRMDEESGRHFIGPVPAERECSGRIFRRVAMSKDSETIANFECLRCHRNLEGTFLPHGKSRLSHPGGQIP